DWKQVHEGLEVQLVPTPDGEEVFILCRSSERQAKEQAMHERFEKRIEEGLGKIAASCGKRRQKSGAVERRVGRLLERNTRAARLFEVQVEVDAQSCTQLRWTKVESWREGARGRDCGSVAWGGTWPRRCSPTASSPRAMKPGVRGWGIPPRTPGGCRYY